MGKNSPKIKISLDLLETLHKSQFDGADYEPDIGIWVKYLKSKFRQFGAEIKISSDLLKNECTSQFESAEYKSGIGIL